jgi:3-dehydroshikimate dehydratase
MADRAAAEGVYLVLETHPNTLMDTLESAVRLLHEADHPMLRVNLDFLHLWETGSEPEEAYLRLKAWTVNYHMKNVSDRKRLSVFDPVNVFAPIRDRTGMTLLDGGAVDYAAVMARIARSDSGHPLAIEWFGQEPERVLRAEMDWIRSAQMQTKRRSG